MKLPVAFGARSLSARRYTKVGFKETGSITTPDGPALMMVLKRDWE
jgi:hypothetical protein